MISIRELYYLNRALDGQKIYGIAPEDDGKIQLFGASKAKEGLIRESILNKDGSINDLSFLILRNLQKYKKSKDYIWINDFVMSMDKSDFLIYLKKKSDGRLLFKKTTKEGMIFNIVKQYEFLWGNEKKEGQSIDVPMEEFLKNKVLVQENKDILYIQKVSNEKIIFCYAYYKEEGKVFKYNFFKESSVSINPLDVRKELLNLYNMEGN